jgi:hypothetical protein
MACVRQYSVDPSRRPNTMLTKPEMNADKAVHLLSAEQPGSEVRGQISREEMIELFDYLEDGLVCDACDHSFRYTEAFLASRGIESGPAIKWICGYGASCDCEILQNMELEWGGPL